MKIALVTIHNANNYGAVLQTYALQKVLSRYGMVEIINYDNRHISRSFDLIRLYPSFHGLLGTGKDIFRLIPRRKAINRFLEFMKNYMHITKSYTKFKLEEKEMFEYDLYIAGSDQIWNPACVSDKNIFDPIYFLNFLSQGSRKVSYASSLGSYQFSTSEKKQLLNYLKTFKHISVREKDAQLLLNDLGLNVEHVLDPTLLLTKKEWLDGFNIKTNSLKEKYILLYTVPKSKLLSETVDYISKKLQIKVIAINQSLTTGAHVDEQIRDAGPLEFINYFASASFVITDSFHGTCFALNFGIPFVSVSAGNNVNRVQSLLSIVGLEDMILKDKNEFQKINFKIDFTPAQLKLVQARKYSIKYLENSLL